MILIYNDLKQHDFFSFSLYFGLFLDAVNFDPHNILKFINMTIICKVRMQTHKKLIDMKSIT